MKKVQKEAERERTDEELFFKYRVDHGLIIRYAVLGALLAGITLSWIFYLLGQWIPTGGQPTTPAMLDLLRIYGFASGLGIGGIIGTVIAVLKEKTVGTRS